MVMKHGIEGDTGKAAKFLSVALSPKLMNGIKNLSPEILLADIYLWKTTRKPVKEVSFQS